MDEFERIKRLYDEHKFIENEDIGKLIEMIDILDRRSKQQNEWYKDDIKKLEKENKDLKEAMTELTKESLLYKVLENILKEKKENG